MKRAENASSKEDNEIMVDGVRDNSLDRSPWSLDELNAHQLKNTLTTQKAGFSLVLVLRLVKSCIYMHTFSIPHHLSTPNHLPTLPPLN